VINDDRAVAVEQDSSARRQIACRSPATACGTPALVKATASPHLVHSSSSSALRIYEHREDGGDTRARPQLPASLSMSARATDTAAQRARGRHLA
jgi:hypothetical protein